MQVLAANHEHKENLPIIPQKNLNKWLHNV